MKLFKKPNGHDEAEVLKAAAVKAHDETSAAARRLARAVEKFSRGNQQQAAAIAQLVADGAAE